MSLRLTTFEDDRDLPRLNKWIAQADHKLGHVKAGPSGVLVSNILNGGSGSIDGSVVGASDAFWTRVTPSLLSPLHLTDSIRTEGFLAIAGASLNNSDAVGYIPINVDYTKTNTVAGTIGPPIAGGNEVRGLSVNVRNDRRAADEPTEGWDFIGSNCASVIDSNNTCPIIGKMIGARGEFFADTCAAPLTHLYAFGLEGTLSFIGDNNTITYGAGLIISTPNGGFGGTDRHGHITNGYGIWVQSQDDSYHVFNSTHAAGIKLDGLDTFGRIKWNGIDLREDTAAGHLSVYYDDSTKLVTIEPSTGLTVFNGNLVFCNSVYAEDIGGPSAVEIITSTRPYPDIGNVRDITITRDFTTSGGKVTFHTSLYQGATEIITAGRSIGNVVDINPSGAIYGGTSISCVHNITTTTGDIVATIGNLSIGAGGTISGGCRVGALAIIGSPDYTVIDSSRNIGNVGTIIASGDITTSTSISATLDITTAGGTVSGNIVSGNTVFGSAFETTGARFGISGVTVVTSGGVKDVVNGLICS